MRLFFIVFCIIALLSCSSKSEVGFISPEPQKVTGSTPKATGTIVSFLSGTRQKVFPGMDDGSGRHTENWILKLDVPREYTPQITLEFMGYIIPIDRRITYISDEEKAVLMFSITYPLMDNYDMSDNPANAKPILLIKTEKDMVSLDISGCQNIAPVAYPAMQKEGGY